VPAERRAELPPLDTGNEAHRLWFAERMRQLAGSHPAHAVEGEALERFYLAQLLRDEVMAASVLEALERYDKVVVCAGLGHIERGLGIPARLGALERLVIIPVASAGEARRRARDQPFPEREADRVWLMR
jgi:hypothetical protein